MATESALLTVGDIARRLGIPNYRVAYAIDKYRIRPTARVGILRAWSEEDLERIASAVKRTANRGEKL